jgi:hypothetical protein
MNKEYERQEIDEDYWEYGELDDNSEYGWSELYGEQLIHDIYDLDEMRDWWDRQLEGFNDVEKY